MNKDFREKLEVAAEKYQEERWYNGSYSEQIYPFIKGAEFMHVEMNGKLEKALEALEWYATPGIHERWKAEEALKEIKGEISE